MEFHGMCDASAAVRLAGTKILVANDDDNTLRTYDAERGGEPLASTDLSAFVAGESKRREAQAAREESDIEGAAIALGKVFWITSHARGDKGKKDDSQSRFFATTLPADGAAPEPSGASYAELRRDFASAAPLAAYRLKKAAKREAEEDGALNIEGLALAPDGASLLIGFRSPLNAGRALVVPLTNAAAVVAGSSPPRFDSPWDLDLGGLGVRDLAAWNGHVLVAAGPPHKPGDFALFAWDYGGGTVARVQTEALAGTSPEALVPFDEARVLALSDDGDRLLDGGRCGKLQPKSARRFRGTWLRITRD